MDCCIIRQKCNHCIKSYKGMHRNSRSTRIFTDDNGSEFVNEELKMYLSKNKIHHIRGSPYHPQSQGAVEVFNRTIFT